MAPGHRLRLVPCLHLLLLAHPFSHLSCLDQGFILFSSVITSLRGQVSSGQPPPSFAFLLFLEHIHPAKQIFFSTFIQGLAKCWKQ